MLPLGEATASDLAKLRGVIFDVDGTVTRGSRLCPEAFLAMNRLADAGVDLIAATGRPLGWARVIVQHWPVKAAIGENGAGWFWREGESVRVGFYAPEEERKAQRVLLEQVRDRVYRDMPDVIASEDATARWCDWAFDIGETVKLPEEERARLRRVLVESGVHVTESSVHMHAVPGTWDKAKGIRRALASIWGTDLDEERGAWAYIGDSANDGPAFAYFPFSVGVANVLDAGDALESRPTYITEAREGLGFAELGNAILAERR